ncbi:hypothetical protein [Proteus hauseri]|uniref:hypothetical protein n=1 Tax=Proteus hauseri TaxID=183417 RepID=UPI0032DB4062
MKISGVVITNQKIDRIKNSDTPLNARTLWEKIKNWFGVGKENIVLPLVNDVFFNNEKSILEKIDGFNQLRNFAGNVYKDKFIVEMKENDIHFSILLNEFDNDEKVTFSWCESEYGNNNSELRNNIIIPLIKHGLSDLLYDAIHEYVERKDIKKDGDKIKQEIIIKLIADNGDKFKNHENLNNEYILKNSITKKADVRVEDFLFELNNLIEKEREKINTIQESRIKESGVVEKKKGEELTLLDKIEKELFNDLSRMSLTFNGEPIADLKNKAEEIGENDFKKSEFNKLKSKLMDVEDKELIFSLLYQKGVLAFKEFIGKQDLFAGMVNVPYNGHTSINITRKDDKIKIEATNEKSLFVNDSDGRKNMDKLIGLGLDYLNEDNYKLVGLIGDEILEKPMEIKDYTKILNDNPKIANLLSVGDKAALEDKITLFFEYDLKKRELTLDNKSSYEYAILRS